MRSQSPLYDVAIRSVQCMRPLWADPEAAPGILLQLGVVPPTVFTNRLGLFALCRK
jgi:hypothetical protein